MFRTSEDVEEIMYHCNLSTADLATDLGVSSSRVIRWSQDGITESEDPEVLDRFAALEASAKPTARSHERYAVCLVPSGTTDESLRDMITRALEEVSDRIVLERVFFLARKAQFKRLIQDSPDLAEEILKDIDKE